jgi:hypothetical protein
MYNVPGALSSLPQEQLVQAVVITEVLGLEFVQQHALQALSIAASAPQGLTAAALRALAGLDSWPNCLKQLLPSIVKNTACCRDSTADLAAIKAADAGGSVQNMLVGALGDLQAVWSDAEEKALLLQLPLPAMQLLLSSDLVRVPAEDTVLYTALQYWQAQTQAADKEAAEAVLAPLIRAPQLSEFALSCAALSDRSCWHLLGAYGQQLAYLLSLKRIASEEELVAACTGAGSAYIAGAPGSWGLGPRQIRPLLDGVRLEWKVSVEQLQQSCKSSFAQQKMVEFASPGSPPLGGVAWRMKIRCRQEEGGTIAGLFIGGLASWKLLQVQVHYHVAGCAARRQPPVLTHVQQHLGLCQPLQAAAHVGGWLGRGSVGRCCRWHANDR